MRARLQRAMRHSVSRTSEQSVSVRNRSSLQNGFHDVHRIQRQVGNKATARLLGGPNQTLPFREATELNECIRIMGEENAAHCRQVVLGEPSTASAPTGPSPPRTFRIVLENLGAARSGRTGVQQTITETFGPLATRAGRQLELGLSPPGDVSLSFDSGGFESRPCGGILILGNEGGGEIFVGAHMDLRVCGVPQRLPNPTGTGMSDQIDYASTVERVFDESDPEFGRFVGNTGVHELAHIISSLPHTSDRGNYLFSVGRLGGNLPRDQRTKASMRLHWGGVKTFNSGQESLLVAAIRSAQYSGGMRMSPGPPLPPTPRRTRTP